MHAPDPPEVLELFHAELDLVEIIAAQVLRKFSRVVSSDELRSAGRVGLLQAARSFDPSRGIPFRAYANYRVYGAMIDDLRKLSDGRDRKIRAAVRAFLSVGEGAVEFVLPEHSESIDEAETEDGLDEHLEMMALAAALAIVVEDDVEEHVAKTDQEAALAHAELIAFVKSHISELAPLEAEVIRRHYFEGHRMEDIAADHDADKSWASRLHTRGMARLKDRLSARKS